jgi:hypothetical protein
LIAAPRSGTVYPDSSPDKVPYTLFSESASICSGKHWPGKPLPRPRHRACLEDGLKLDLNHLARKGFIKFGKSIGARGIAWSNSHHGQIATGVITADMADPSQAWIRVAIGSFVQQITLQSRPRHLGGRQWFFVCPLTGGLATVLWKPPGATRFYSRQAWGRQVAYRSQFQSASDRAHLGKERIKARLIGNLDPAEWDLPPKPKWMRWGTYNRYVERFDDYEEMLDDACIALVSKKLRLKGV